RKSFRFQMERDQRTGDNLLCAAYRSSFGALGVRAMAASAGDVASLLEAARSGSQEALGQLLELSRGYLLMVANGELASDLQAKGGPSDLVQETFLEAKRDFRQFQGGSEAELLAWLRRVLLNNVANFTRRYRTSGKRSVEREVTLDSQTSRALE